MTFLGLGRSAKHVLISYKACLVKFDALYRKHFHLPFAVTSAPTNYAPLPEEAANEQIRRNDSMARYEGRKWILSHRPSHFMPCYNSQKTRKYVKQRHIPERGEPSPRATHTSL